MNKPLISIIVPVYNVEQYIEECLNSIVNQEFKDYEVILVDDGSTDSCAEICDFYAEMYHFRAIHQANAGLSAARNIGIKEAEGQYLLFLDSDDFLIDEDALKMIADGVDKNHPELLICLPNEYDESGSKVIYQHNPERWIEGTIYQSDNIVDELYRVNGIWVTLAQTKIIKRSFCLEKNLLFYEGIYHEDDEWIARVLLSNPSLSFLYKPWYGYRHRENSIVSSADAKKEYKRACDKIKVVSSMLSNEQAKKYKEFVKYAADYLFNTIISANKFSEENRKDFLKYIEKYRDCYSTIRYSKDIKLILKELYIRAFGEEKFIYKYKG